MGRVSRGLLSPLWWEGCSGISQKGAQKPLVVSLIEMASRGPFGISLMGRVLGHLLGGCSEASCLFAGKCIQGALLSSLSWEGVQEASRHLLDNAHSPPPLPSPPCGWYTMREEVPPSCFSHPWTLDLCCYFCLGYIVMYWTYSTTALLFTMAETWLCLYLVSFSPVSCH